MKGFRSADNARGHHAVLVRQRLERPGCRIKLVFLPAYAPHFNAIERSWGVMRRDVTDNSFHATFAQLTEAIRFLRQETAARVEYPAAPSLINFVSSHTRSFGFWSEPGISR